MTEVCEAIRAKIEQDFRNTVRIERLSKRGKWKEVPWTFTMQATSVRGMVCQLEWQVVETKRTALYRGFKNGQPVPCGFWGNGRQVDPSGSFSIVQQISLTSNDLGLT